jgi:hypothetical protein
MLKRYGSYFADWRDATGLRHRKAFPTLQEAVDYTEQMRAEAHQPESPNSHPPRLPLRKPRRSTSARKRTTRTRKPRSRRS